VSLRMCRVMRRGRGAIISDVDGEEDDDDDDDDEDDDEGDEVDDSEVGLSYLQKSGLEVPSHSYC